MNSMKLFKIFFLKIVMPRKKKAIPFQAWTVPEDSRNLRLPESGKVVNPTHRPPLTPGNIPGTHFC